jgi:cysteine desulfurase family protein (TIGR01976 family)
VFTAATIRDRFPALGRRVGGDPAVYADGPGGTQVPDSVIAAMASLLGNGASNVHGGFDASDASDAVVGSARAAVADLFNCTPGEVVFGQNMTSLTLAMSRAIGRTWREGDNVVVTRLDHDGNVWPWVLAARDAGVEIRWADFDPSAGCALDLDSLRVAVDDRTRLVAVTRASNALGVLVDVAAVGTIAHEVGALVYVDAVHFGPHGSIDVAAWDCDYLVASAYKFFGPHTGCLFGRGELLAAVEPYKIRPAPDEVPDRWETGTQSFESLAGVAAAVDYLAEIGEGHNRRARLVSALEAITGYERSLSDRFLIGLSELPEVRLYGPATSTGRVPTFAIEIDGRDPSRVAAALAASGIFVWAGNYYAVEVMGRLAKRDGLVRVGFVHYNTPDEVDRVVAALADQV